MKEGKIPYFVSEIIFASNLKLPQLAGQLDQLLSVHFDDDTENTFDEFKAYRSTTLGLQLDLLCINDGLYQLSLVPHSTIDITVGDYEQTDISLWLKKVLTTIPAIMIVENK